MEKSHPWNLLIILGPTASGKTILGVELARTLNGEIISADSRQVFRRMNIGTGKDLHEYGEIPHHLIDILNPGDEFSLFAFLTSFSGAFTQITDHGHVPVLVGGTGLYIDAVVRNYQLVEVPEDPELRRALDHLTLQALQERLHRNSQNLHNMTDLLDRNRLIRAIEISEAGEKETHQLPELRPLVIGIRWERTLLRQRITQRLKERLKAGMIDEVVNLRQDGIPDDTLDAYGLEYRYITRYLRGELSHNDMTQKLTSAIHDFAKRQETWFRRMERSGVIIHWVNGANHPIDEALRLVGQ